MGGEGRGGKGRKGKGGKEGECVITILLTCILLWIPVVRGAHWGTRLGAHAHIIITPPRPFPSPSLSFPPFLSPPLPSPPLPSHPLSSPRSRQHSMEIPTCPATTCVRPLTTQDWAGPPCHTTTSVPNLTTVWTRDMVAMATSSTRWRPVQCAVPRVVPPLTTSTASLQARWKEAWTRWTRLANRWVPPWEETSFPSTPLTWPGSSGLSYQHTSPPPPPPPPPPPSPSSSFFSFSFTPHNRLVVQSISAHAVVQTCPTRDSTSCLHLGSSLDLHLCIRIRLLSIACTIL